MIKLYSDIATRETILETWGASTKHPDAVHKYRADIEKGHFIESEYAPPEMNCFQWLLYTASVKTWWFHAKEIAQYAIDIYDSIHR